MHRRTCGIFTSGLLMLIAARPSTQPDTDSDQPVGPTAQPIKLVEFTNNQLRFRLGYPAEWTVLDHPVNNQVFSLQTQPVNAADGKLGVVGLRIDTGPEGTSDSEILKDVSDAMVDYLFNHGGKKIAIKSSSLGALNARQVQVTTEHPTGDTEAMYVIAVHKRTEYVFTIAAPAAEFVKMLPKVNALLRSFEVLD